MKRRDVLKSGLVLAGTTAMAAPAIAQSAPTIRWRLTSSFPKSLDTIYGASEVMAKTVNDITGGRFQIQEAYAGKEMESHHGGFVISGDYVYGTSQAALVCLELKTGKVAWQGRSAGKGSITLADGHLILRGEGGGVALVEASPTAFKEKGSFNLPKSGGQGAWAYPVVANGHLFIRDMGVLWCYEIKSPATASAR